MVDNKTVRTARRWPSENVVCRILGDMRDAKHLSVRHVFKQFDPAAAAVEHHALWNEWLNYLSSVYSWPFVVLYNILATPWYCQPCLNFPTPVRSWLHLVMNDCRRALLWNSDAVPLSTDYAYDPNIWFWSGPIDWPTFSIVSLSIRLQFLDSLWYCEKE